MGSCCSFSSQHKIPQAKTAEVREENSYSSHAGNVVDSSAKETQPLENGGTDNGHHNGNGNKNKITLANESISAVVTASSSGAASLQSIASTGAGSNGLGPRKPGGFEKNYSLGPILGKGNYSTVRLGTHLATGKQVAVKCIKDKDLTREDREALHLEIEILQKLDHPNIIKFYDFFPEKNIYYIVTEFVGGGELFDRIVEKEFYSEEDAAKVIRTISLALKYCHDRAVVHRDLKPENILLSVNEKGVIDDGHIKLADFGFAKVSTGTGDSGLTTSCGTPGYVAPEILKGQSYGKEVDMWSLGVILYILLCGYPPFIEDEATGQRGLFDKIKNGKFAFEPVEYWKDVSALGKELISKLMVLDPKKRLRVDDVLVHPWISMSLGERAKHEISGAQERLKQFQVKKKWKIGITGIVAANRLSSTLTSSQRTINIDPDSARRTSVKSTVLGKDSAGHPESIDESSHIN